MGWQAAGFSEIEKFPSEVLAHHYPTVTNFGDMTKYKEWNLNDPIGLLVGGTPCQSFSVAGLRKGLDDPRGNLALTYLGILDHFRPKWCVWENVPGVLSSGGGRDFGAFLGALGELGYGFAYRVLDAQNFGVAQRRRRVFVVGCLGDWRAAAEVLFESDCLRGDIKKSRKEGQDPAAFTTSSFGNYGEGVGTIRATGGDLGGGSETLYVPDTARCLTRGVAQKNDYETDTFVTKVYENHAQDSRVKEVDVSPTVAAKWGTGGGNVPIAIQGNLIGRDKGGPQGVGVSEGETMYTLTKADVHGVAFGWQNSASQSMSVDTITPTLDKSKTPAVAYSFDSLASNSMKSSNPISGCRQVELSKTIDTTYPCPSKNQGGIGIMQPISFDSYNQSVSNLTHTLRVGRGADELPMTISQMAVRRLTPVECERLQGFPDNYTNIKDKCPDGPRYKAMGNSMAVPVMRWIGERINKVNSLL
jgi:DNA (cytosine-5)-methyltransferase 1